MLYAARRQCRASDPDIVSPRAMRMLGSDPAAIAVYYAIDELDRAAAASATMPIMKGRSAHARISDGVDELDTAPVAAVLPCSP
jgi:hypothetical protein